MAKYQDIGGQAVLEGVMMKSKEHIALAVRTPSGAIELRHLPTKGKGAAILSWPFIRGVISMGQSLTLGMKTLEISANLGGEESQEPSPFEKKLAQILGKNAQDIMFFLAAIIAIVMAVGLFIVLPTVLSAPLKLLTQNAFALNMLEGGLRIVIFLTYIILVSRVKDIQRVFMYHGAEHKTIHCFEAGQDLTPENALTFSCLHPRCGTSFMLIVMVISILVFSVLGIGGHILIRIFFRLLLLPVVAGISFEVLKLLSKSENVFVRLLRWPGIQLQRLTTREPDAGMLEVAITAFKGALYGPVKPQEDDLVTEIP